MISLYIHIPFCKRLCPYCAFYKLITQPDTIDRFIAALGREMTAYSSREGRLAVHTIYVGGGTPSELPLGAWKTLLSELNRHFDLTNTVEFTVELNPESVTPGYVEALHGLGVNRASLGVQSMNETELLFLGRGHRADSVAAAAMAIQEAGIRNWSVDVIYALPNSTVETLDNTVSQLLALNPTHVSVYELTIEPNTKFERLRIQPSPTLVQLAQYELIQSRLASAGFQQYEFSAFSRPGCESKHNLGYWQFRPYVGIGPGAHSFFKNCRYATQMPFPTYLDTADFQPGYGTQLPDSNADLVADFVMVQLRLVDGIDLNQAKMQLGVDILNDLSPAISKLVQDGFLSVENNRLIATRKGWPLIDQLALELLSR